MIAWSSGSYDVDVQRAVDMCRKIGFCSHSPQTWITNLDVTNNVHAMVAGTVKADLPNMEAGELPDLTAWPILQEDAVKEYNPKLVLSRADGLKFYAPTPHEQLLIVPVQLRKALVVTAHLQQCHMHGSAVFTILRRRYHWPTMRRDVKAWVRQCKACQLGDIRRRHAHGLYRPRSTVEKHRCFAIDFYGMATAANGDDTILTCVDMASRRCYLISQKGRGAEQTAFNLWKFVICAVGYPDTWISDSAREFTGGVFAALSKLCRATQKLTEGYSARANGVCERVHEALGRMLRCLDDHNYKVWPQMLPAMRFALNVAYKTVLGASPHEIEFGQAPRTLLDAYSEHLIPRDGLGACTESGLHDRLHLTEMSAKDMSFIRQKTAAFADIARKTSAWHRRQTAEQLNARGHKAKVFKVDDLVRVYKPPGKTAIDARGRIKKHTEHYDGPYRVVRVRDGGRRYDLERVHGAQTLSRNLTNVLPWYGPAGDDSHEADPFKVDEIIAVRDTNVGKGCRKFSVAVVTSADENVIRYKFLGTTVSQVTWKRNPGSVTFHPIVHPTDEEGWAFESAELVQADPTQWVPYTGDMDLTATANLVVARGLKLNVDGSLDSESIAAINEAGIKHLTHERLF